MEGNGVIEGDLVLRIPRAASCYEVLEQTAGRLHAKGCVKDSFEQALIEREHNFPTGIRVGNINVAIPHTDTVHVERTAIAVALLDEPVAFRELGAPQNEVGVSIVLNLAIKDGSQQVGFLKRVMALIQDQDCLSRLLACDDADAIASFLQGRLAQ